MKKRVCYTTSMQWLVKSNVTLDLESVWPNKCVVRKMWKHDTLWSMMIKPHNKKLSHKIITCKDMARFYVVWRFAYIPQNRWSDCWSELWTGFRATLNPCRDFLPQSTIDIGLLPPWAPRSGFKLHICGLLPIWRFHCVPTHMLFLFLQLQIYQECWFVAGCFRNEDSFDRKYSMV